MRTKRQGFHSIYYPRNRAVPDRESRLQEFCTWVGHAEPEPQLPLAEVVYLDLPAFLRRQAD